MKFHSIKEEKEGDLMGQENSLKEVFHASSVIFTAIMGVGFIIPFLPDFSKRAGGEEFVGLIYSGFALARIVAVPLASMLSDRFGRKPFIVSGLILYSVFSVLYPHAHDFLSLFVVRVFHGIASSMIIPVSFAYAIDYIKLGREGVAAAVLGGSLLLGFGLGPALGGIIGNKLGEEYAFYFMAIMGVIALGQAIALMKEPPERKVSQKNIIEEVKSIFTSHVFLTAFSIWFFIMWQRGVVISYSPLALEDMGFSKMDIGLMITGYALLSSFLQYSSAKIVDKVHDRFSFSFFVSILSSLIIAGISYTTQSYIIILIFVSSGALSALCYPFIMAEVGHEAKKEGRVGGTIGFMDWAFSFGNLIGPTTMGFLSTKFGVVGIFEVLGLGQTAIFLIMYLFYYKSSRKASNH